MYSKEKHALTHPRLQELSPSLFHLSNIGPVKEKMEEGKEGGGEGRKRVEGRKKGEREEEEGGEGATIEGGMKGWLEVQNVLWVRAVHDDEPVHQLGVALHHSPERRDR